MKDKLFLIKKFYWKNHRLPSYSEMLKIFNLSSKNSIFKIVKKLIEKGFLKKINNKLTPTSKFFSLPLLGLVKAGFPILAEENREYLTLDEYLIDDPNSCFLLKVSGESLTGVGVFDGDIVIIQRKRQAFPGDIVLAQIDKEWTLKILRKNRITGKFYLESANANYQPMHPRYDLQIFGVVKAVIRKFN